ncbi:MAG: F0F1 ATP synthase subunit A, partial [Bacteroidota bacterium]
MFLIMQAFAYAKEPVSINQETTEEQKVESGEKFNAGKLVMEHIADSHDWHIYGSEEHPVSIPLPIIIYDKEKGWSIFSSSRFNHGHASYNGYKIEEGQIASEEGISFYDFSITKNVLSIFFVAAIMLMVFISVARTYTRNKDEAPSGLQNAIEPVIMFVRDDIAKA